MPAKPLMSWDPGPRTWRKMRGGVVHKVSVRQLRDHFGDPTIPDTKEGSYRWANRWWQEWSAAEPVPGPTVRVQYHDLDTGEPLGVFHDMPRSDYDFQRSRHEDLIRRARELLSRDPPAPADRTVGFRVGLYLDLLRRRHEAGEISVSEYANARAGLFHFRDWLNPQTAVDALDPERWQGYYLHLIGPCGPRSVVTRRKHFRYARNFLRWLDDLGVHPAPKNLDRRQYRFKGGDTAVRTLTTEVVSNVIDAATGQLRLHLLLMANCGFTQQDNSDLKPGEVDWEHGRVLRKRSKTGDHASVPAVDYLLWDETFALLKRYRSAGPDHVLLTETERVWVRDAVKGDGSRARTDAVQSCYRHLSVTPRPPLKLFRKTSSTLLNGSPEHGRFAVHFLGHAPDVAHRHYISSNGPSFDAAVRWLGVQYGYGTTRV